jgi:hypothetical protein
LARVKRKFYPLLARLTGSGISAQNLDGISIISSVNAIQTENTSSIKVEGIEKIDISENESIETKGVI